MRSRGTAWLGLQARSRPHRSRIERRRGRLCAVAWLWGLFEVVTLDRLAADWKRRMDACASAIIEDMARFVCSHDD